MHRSLRRVALALVVATGLAFVPVAPAPFGAAPAVAAKKNRKKHRKKLLKSVRQGGLAKLPSVADAVAGHARGRGRLVAAGDVSGTPPALVDLPASAIADVFWRSGVVARIGGGTPTPDDCNEFYAGNADGRSGGLGACHMAESVGQSLGALLEGETSLCFMKRLPTVANVEAGGVTVVSGAPPDDDITKLFVPPDGAASRIVQVRVRNMAFSDPSAQHVNLRVYGAAENRAAGHLFRTDIWFCDVTDTDPPRGYNRLVLDTAGRYTSEDANADGDGVHLNTVTGWVTGNGLDLVWDTARTRTAATASTHPHGAFKAEVEVGSDDRIRTRAWSIDGGGGGGGHKVYSVTRFSGTSAFDVRFLAGAFREASGGSNQGATEFRDTFYAAAPGSTLLDEVGAVDLASDPFFATPPAPTVDASAYSCALPPDVVVAMDFANPNLVAVVDACQSEAFRGMHFCHENTAVRAADQNFRSVCGH